MLILFGVQQLVGAIQIGTGLVALLFLKPALENLDTPGSRGFVVFVFAVVGYAIPSGVDLFTTDYTLSVTAQTVTNCAGVLVGVSWLFLAIEVSDRVRVTRRLVAGLGLYALAGWTLAVTNPGGIVLGPADLLGTQLQLNGRPGFWFLLGMSNLQVFVGTGLLAAESLDATGLRRRQLGLLALAIIPASVASVTTGVLLQTPNATLGYDVTPFGWVGTLAVFAVALYSGRFLDLTSIARERAFENMSDPIVTLDDQNRVVDSNPAARSLAGVADAWEGLPAEEFFASFASQGTQFWTAETDETEITLERDGRQRHFTLSVSPIAGPQGRRQGRLIALREVTLLKEREQKLDLMRQVQSRVLRHNIRNDMQLIRAAIETAIRQFDESHRPIAERALETSDELLAVSAKVRAVEDLVDREQTVTTITLDETLADVTDRYRDAFPEASFSLRCPEDCRVRTIPAISLVFENLLENAAEHNDSETPTVDVRVETEQTEAVVTIQDDGPGIPDHELTVLDRGEETPLEHGSGIGLWVVHWVIDNTAATIAYDTSPEGTTVTVRLPLADGSPA